MRARAFLIAAAMAAAILPPTEAISAPPPGPGAYRGLGAWIDIFDPGAWRHPGRVVRRLADRGVRTLYLETTNYHRRGPILHPGATGKFIDAAHARGMKIVGWYLPGFRKLGRDLRRSLAAINFRSPQGGRFDSFALDIEASIVKNVAKRTARLLALSNDIRQTVGGDYPLGAIIPSPRGMEIKKSYWPGFPYAELAGIYDVFMTMTYYSWRAKGPKAVSAYMRRSMDILREKTGMPNVPVHVIGGLADASSRKEGRAFVRVAREYGVLGASLYDNAIMDRRDWRVLRRVQPNLVQSAPMPFAFWSQLAPAGNAPGFDESHPDEVVFRTTPLSGGVELDYEGFDIGAGEVRVFANWKLVGTLPAGLPAAWAERRTVAVPRSLLRTGSLNVFAFVPTSRHPSWPTWGVRNVTLNAAPLPLTDRGQRGALPGAGTMRADRVTYAFTSDGSALSVTLRGYDIGAGEAKVLLNGTEVATLLPTASGAWGSDQTVALSPSSGANRLTIDSTANPSGLEPWGVQIVTVS